MPDITMCSSTECPERNNCYRATANPGTLQSWNNFEYFCNENNGFEYFMGNYFTKKKGDKANESNSLHNTLPKM